MLLQDLNIIYDMIDFCGVKNSMNKEKTCVQSYYFFVIFSIHTDTGCHRCIYMDLLLKSKKSERDHVR
jgi:hypothetical protein